MPPHTGAKHHFASLSDDDVREVRRLYSEKASNGHTYESLASQFKSKPSTIRDLIKLRTRAACSAPNSFDVIARWNAPKMRQAEEEQAEA